ncbi:AGAP010540-PA-like protein [Anopheles sinensis]|uniref:AGAP010540-PA-like protein n=1 Tax=Anopheles sinensis TaxID=74873 RepID=A0A084WAV1_ANOSI|nr:AGAP010540-PA-like protein [Anopheles sinensis]
MDQSTAGPAKITSSSNTLSHTPDASHSSDLECIDENVIIDEITEAEPTSVTLRFCKRKFLRPFVIILASAGLRPSATDLEFLGRWVGHLQTILVLVLLIIGYVLQFLCGLSSKNNYQKQSLISTSAGDTGHYGLLASGEAIFIYLVPALLHLNGYIMAVFIYRFADNEQLQSLVERVFILSNNPRRLVLTLWLYFGLGLAWLAASTTYVALLGTNGANTCVERFSSFQWMAGMARWEGTGELLKVMLIVTLFFHDLVQMVVIVSYGLMCYMLRCYLQALKEKLLLHTIEPLNWMREICEFRKLLHHLNTRISLPVASLTVLNLSYTVASVAHLFRDMTACPINIFTASLANVLLWLVIALIPFFQAASLTVTCRQTQSCGHLISIRPFVHRNTSSEDLNTVLLYASSLKMSAKLFRMPVSAHYLCFLVLVCFIGIVTFGMCLNISLGRF